MAGNQTEIRYRFSPGKGKRVKSGAPGSPVAPAQLPRITRLMALAIKLEAMRNGQGIRNGAELARLGHVSRSRVSQILNLRFLAPDIQERLLFLEPIREGREPIHERALRALVQCEDWAEQRRRLGQFLRAIQ